MGVAAGASGIPQRHARAETDGAGVTGDQPRRGTFAPTSRCNTQRLQSTLNDATPTEWGCLSLVGLFDLFARTKLRRIAEGFLDAARLFPDDERVGFVVLDWITANV